MKKAYFSHKSSVVDKGAKVGAGTKIWHFSHISRGAKIGKACNIGQNVYVGNVKIGNNVKIQNNVSIYDGVQIGDNVFCGPSMVFTNVFNPRCEYPRKHEYRKTMVNNGATIGANVVVVCGHELGKYAFVGAGSVVTKDVPAYALMYGNPAKLKGWMCECGEKLRFSGRNSVCGKCRKKYTKLSPRRVERKKG